MGNVCFTGAPIEYGNEENLTDIEKKLKHQFRNRGRDHQHPMDGLGVLTRNIQTIANANNTIRDVFTTYDKDEDGSINLEEFGEALDSLGLTVSKDLRDDVLQEAEFQPGKGMDQSEFLIYIALLYLLQSNNEMDPNVRAAIEISIDSFLPSISY